ncbi:cytochrome P450 94C1-like [Zingiber officinale]|uniref:Cytochrome P450 n=1 Tax=Zingiber officinale TaxID=94328 RepID=A0A8J5G586_ZINOF|nr:cytochrome P450 94C1-like [Zingiber officinale]KAG6496513.1 hypothetical protein ZIOFF_044380 [Zingiber officinale]
MESEGGRVVGEYYLSLVFFCFAGAFVLLAAALKLLRSMQWWCSCPVCEAYVTGSWTAAGFDNLSDWYAHLLRCSPTRTIHIHVLGNIVTADPANVEHILRARFPIYPKGKPFSAILGDLLGRGIFNVDGPDWRFQQKLSRAELCSPAVRLFAARVVAAETRARLLPLLERAAETGETLDLQDVFRRFAFDNMCAIAFGLDPGCLRLSLPASTLASAFDAASRLSAWRATATVPLVWKAKRLLRIGSERKLREAIGVVNVLANDLIRERRKLGSANGQDLLSRFMGVVADDDEYLRDIVVSFLLAGRDTVASALTSFFWLLARHVEVSSAMREEIDRVLSGSGGEAVVVTADKMREMQYVHAAIFESMRLFPPVQFDSKFCTADDVLPDGTAVRRGTRVTYHAYAMGRMEELWGEDCGDFRPQRWLRGEGGVFAPESAYKYPVFQGGYRVCLGKEMAIMEMKTVAVAVVRRFDFEVLGGEGRKTPKFAPGLTASLAGGLPVRVRRRDGRRMPSIASAPSV